MSDMQQCFVMFNQSTAETLNQLANAKALNELSTVVCVLWKPVCMLGQSGAP